MSEGGGSKRCCHSFFERFASFGKLRIIQFSFGRVAERLNAAVLKTVDE